MRKVLFCITMILSISVNAVDMEHCLCTVVKTQEKISFFTANGECTKAVCLKKYNEKAKKEKTPKIDSENQFQERVKPVRGSGVGELPEPAKKASP